MTDDDFAIKRLFAAVIIQALKDATMKPTKPSARVAQAQAHAWLTARSGVTANNFEAVCLAADIEPSKVRQFYLTYDGPPLTDQILSRLRDKMLKE